MAPNPLPRYGLDSRAFRWRTAWLVSRALAFLLCVLPGLVAAPQSPEQLKPQGYVNDFAGVLSQSAQNKLTALCTEVQQKTGAQIAVVTVKSIGDRPIEDYSIDLATRWGIGPKQKDNGILILLAVDDHKYRVEVGYGLEGILPDGKVGGFGREAVPLLREKNYDGALLLMTRRVADVIAADRGVTLTPSPAVPKPRSESVGSPEIGVIALIVFFFLLIRLLVSANSRQIRGRYRGGGWWIGPMMGGWGGGGFGGGGWGGSGWHGGSGGGFGGFGGGSFGGGGASGSW